MQLRLSDVLSALSDALDLAAGHPRAHAERSCIIGMRLAVELGLGDDERASLFYALLLKDAGLEVASAAGLDAAALDAVAAVNEHWDGRGEPLGAAGDELPLLGRIVCLAQTAEAFWELGGSRGACEVARERSGSWFDPLLVDALCAIEDDTRFWVSLEIPQVGRWEPSGRVELVGDERLDRVAEAFAMLVDGQSPYTPGHSRGVATLSVRIAEVMGLGAQDRRDLHLAGLLHDLGMLGVPGNALDHPGKLDGEERRRLRMHPKRSLEILSRIWPLRRVARLAAVHHERLDGSGYFLGLTGAQLDLPSRVLAVAEVAQGLGARRSYRNAFPIDDVLWIMSQGAGTKVDADVYEALTRVLTGPPALDVVEEVDAEVVHGLQRL